MSRFDWLLRRLALRAGAELEIDARHLYILPTRFGWLYGVTVLLMLVAATNYANNPAYLLTFLLAGNGLAALFLTWRNLHRLRLTALAPEPVFAGECARLRLRFADTRRAGIVAQLGDHAALLDPDDEQGRIVELPFATRHRGWQLPGELILSTRHPLGLFVAWSVIRVQVPVLVYPRPLGTTMPRTDEGEPRIPGDEEWQGLREFRPGDSLARVDWKGLARERGLMTKLFHDADHEQPLDIDWETHAPADTETRLARMTAEVLAIEGADRPWTLRLPDQTLGPARGGMHRELCLRSLALYGLSGDPPA